MSCTGESKLVGKWSGLLDGIANREAMALLLENQRLVNEQTDSDQKFKRISIPLVRRIFDEKICLLYTLVRVSPLSTNTDNLTTKMFKTTWPELVLNDWNIRECNCLDREAEQTFLLAINLCNELNAEVIEDLRGNVNTTFETGKTFDFGLCTIKHAIYKKIGYYPNWVIGHPKMIEALKDQICKSYGGFTPRYPSTEWHDYSQDEDFWFPIRPLPFGNNQFIQDKHFDFNHINMDAYKVGVLADTTYIAYKYMPTNELLVGYKGCSSFGPAGYVYNPYIPLVKSPVMFNKDTLEMKSGIMTCHGKRLICGDFYGKVIFKENA